MPRFFSHYGGRMPTFEAQTDAGNAGLGDNVFRLLVEQVSEYAIFLLDTSGRIASWNAGAQRIKGYRGEEIIDQHFSKFYPEQDVRAGKCEMELEVASREGRFEDEGWRIRKDGTSFWANVVITALRDASGQLTGFAKVTRDLTERRAAELEKLRLGQEARERMHALAEFARWGERSRNAKSAWLRWRRARASSVQIAAPSTSSTSGVRT
jgi:PAS domain S-box-containing protein